MVPMIYKYQLRPGGGIQEHYIFQDAAILSAQIQKGEICLWALVDLDRSLESRQFTIVATGQALPPDLLPKLRFLGTVQEAEFLVWHIFEVKK